MKASDANFIRAAKSIYDQEARERVSRNITMKVFDYLWERNKCGLSDIALTYCGVRITYETMFRNIQRYAGSLKKYGIREGDIVTVALPNIPEIVYIEYALNRLGAVANLIDPRSNPKRLLECSNRADSKLLIASSELYREKVEPIIRELKAEHILLISASDSMRFGGTVKACLAKALLGYRAKRLLRQERNNPKIVGRADFLRQFASFADTQYVPDTPFSIYYTSGTTGKCKGVVATNEAYNAMAEEMNVAGLDFRRGETFLGVIPFFSAYGSLSGMHNALANGWNIILIPKFDPNEFDLLLKKYRPNNALGVPRWWEQVIYHHNLDDTDMSFLKRPVTGGDMISGDTIRKINEYFDAHGATGVKLKVGYGASEFGGCVSATCEDHGFYDADSSGILLPNARGIVIDPDTREELGVNVPGELCFHSLSMMKEYFHEPEETESLTVYQDGVKYYRTGDKGTIDENGSVHFIDRYKRAMMRPDGHTVHAAPIESVIMASHIVEGCCVVGLRQEGLSGTIPSAFVELKDKSLPVEKAVDILDRLSVESLPERDKALIYIVVQDLRYTSMEKVDYRYYEQLRLDALDYIVKDPTFFKKC